MTTRQSSQSDDDARDAATAHYKRRSEAFYRLLTEGLPDNEDGDLSPEERTLAEWGHRRLGRAQEGEVFGDREREEQGEGSSPDDL